jgi:hypothetical protein
MIRRHKSMAVVMTAVVVLASACGSTTDAPVANDATATSPATAASPTVTNTWVGEPVDQTALPIGTRFVSATAPAVGGLYVCATANPRGRGAFRTGPWIDEAAGTWDATSKVAVRGEVPWPMATYDETVSEATRTITSNGLPVGLASGTFPIAADDPAYAYDRNPNRIAESSLTLTLPRAPAIAGSPACLPMGRIGVLRNGVGLFAPVDEMLRDAVAYETQDACDGHPEQRSTYHYHDVPSCILDASTGPSTVVGWAFDGHPIVVERDAAGYLPTNADLDNCHGRTSPVLLDGDLVETYHYSVTREFPYVLGCFRSTPLRP